MIDSSDGGVRAAEIERCAAIQTQDFRQLETLLHPSMIHVHTRGNQDARESYLKYLAEIVEILEATRGMQIWVREAGTWRQVGFQATPIGAAPPPIRSDDTPK
jgi:hypothetical protein